MKDENGHVMIRFLLRSWKQKTVDKYRKEGRIREVDGETYFVTKKTLGLSPGLSYDRIYNFNFQVICRGEKTISARSAKEAIAKGRMMVAGALGASIGQIGPFSIQASAYPLRDDDNGRLFVRAEDSD